MLFDGCLFFQNLEDWVVQLPKRQDVVKTHHQHYGLRPQFCPLGFMLLLVVVVGFVFVVVLAATATIAAVAAQVCGFISCCGTWDNWSWCHGKQWGLESHTCRTPRPYASLSLPMNHCCDIKNASILFDCKLLFVMGWAEKLAKVSLLLTSIKLIVLHGNLVKSNLLRCWTHQTNIFQQTIKQSIVLACRNKNLLTKTYPLSV